MSKATLEVLEKGEQVIGSPTAGRYHVFEYMEDEQVGGPSFSTMNDANDHVSKYIRESDDE